MTMLNYGFLNYEQLTLTPLTLTPLTTGVQHTLPCARAARRAPSPRG